jgi:hypothetical protein
MADSYLAMAREAASLCSSIQVQLTELAAMEAAGATKVEVEVEIEVEDGPSVCVNVYILEKMVRYRNFYLVIYRFSDPLN